MRTMEKILCAYVNDSIQTGQKPQKKNHLRDERKSEQNKLGRVRKYRAKI
jgi:hypothetical protein